MIRKKKTKKKKKKKPILTNALFHIILLLLLQKSGLERKKSLKLKSTQISISSRGKSFSISCLVASLLSKFPRKPIFPFILKETNPLNFFLFGFTIIKNILHYRHLLNAMMSPIFLTTIAIASHHLTIPEKL